MSNGNYLGSTSSNQLSVLKSNQRRFPEGCFGGPDLGLYGLDYLTQGSVSHEQFAFFMLANLMVALYMSGAMNAHADGHGPVALHVDTSRHHPGHADFSASVANVMLTAARDGGQFLLTGVILRALEQSRMDHLGRGITKAIPTAQMNEMGMVPSVNSLFSLIHAGTVADVYRRIDDLVPSSSRKVNKEMAALMDVPELAESGRSEAIPAVVRHLERTYGALTDDQKKIVALLVGSGVAITDKGLIWVSLSSGGGKVLQTPVNLEQAAKRIARTIGATGEQAVIGAINKGLQLAGINLYLLQTDPCSGQGDGEGTQVVTTEQPAATQSVSPAETPAATVTVTIEGLPTVAPGETPVPALAWRAPSSPDDVVFHAVNFDLQGFRSNGEALVKAGIGVTQWHMVDNGLSGNDYRASVWGVNSRGNVVWAYIQAQGKVRWGEFPSYYIGGTSDLFLDGVTYVEIPDSQGATVFYMPSAGPDQPPLLVKDLVTLPDGRQVFSMFWNTQVINPDGSYGAWQSVQGVKELMAAEVVREPDGHTIVNGYLTDTHSNPWKQEVPADRYEMDTQHGRWSIYYQDRVVMVVLPGGAEVPVETGVTPITLDNGMMVMIDGQGIGMVVLSDNSIQTVENFQILDQSTHTWLKWNGSSFETAQMNVDTSTYIIDANQVPAEHQDEFNSAPDNPTINRLDKPVPIDVLEGQWVQKAWSERLNRVVYILSQTDVPVNVIVGIVENGSVSRVVGVDNTLVFSSDPATRFYLKGYANGEIKIIEYLREIMAANAWKNTNTPIPDGARDFGSYYFILGDGRKLFMGDSTLQVIVQKGSAPLNKPQYVVPGDTYVDARLRIVFEHGEYIYRSDIDPLSGIITSWLSMCPSSKSPYYYGYCSGINSHGFGTELKVR